MSKQEMTVCDFCCGVIDDSNTGFRFDCNDYHDDCAFVCMECEKVVTEDEFGAHADEDLCEDCYAKKNKCHECDCDLGNAYVQIDNESKNLCVDCAGEKIDFLTRDNEKSFAGWELYVDNGGDWCFLYDRKEDALLYQGHSDDIGEYVWGAVVPIVKYASMDEWPKLSRGSIEICKDKRQATLASSA